MKYFFRLFSLLALSLGTFFFFSDFASAQAFSYTPLESLPGSADASSFPDYVQGIYKFGMWTVGLAALFMITVGGFLYLSSAGNTSTMGTAKNYIWDAIIGLVLAILAWLILNIINPDLVNVNLGRFSQVGGEIVPATASTPTAPPVANTQNGSLPNARSITASTYPDTWFPDSTQSTAIATLNGYNIIVKDSAGHQGESALCRTEGQSGSCTSLYGIPNDVVTTMSSLANACRTYNNNSWCVISITGGTEYWKHSDGTHHMPGNPVIDIGKNSSSQSFKNYLQSVVPNPTCVAGGKNVYTVPVNTSFGIKYVYLWDEDSEHWHVNIGKSMCN